MSSEIPVTVPDIGDFEDVDVIEILVKVGDMVEIEDPLITLESDKAMMDIPAPRAGRVTNITVAVGDKVSEHSIIATIAPAEHGGATDTTIVPDAPSQEPPRPGSGAAGTDAADVDRHATEAPTPRHDDPVAADGGRTPGPPATSGSAGASPKAYASPSIRKFARELGVDLGLVSGSGRKGRIVKSDVQAFVKSVFNGNRAPAQGGFAYAELPPVDFSKFGPIETRPLTKIKRLTGQNLHRSWVTAPHVTQFDEADITELEAFRKSKLADAEEHGVKLTLLAFLIKAVVVVLKKYPDFNASLSPDGESIVYKAYFNIGIAVNTDRGLVVPVVKGADQKGLYQLAGEIRELGAKARAKRLAPTDMQGACFTISSLGGVGGTAFTPIINVPEVAILGVSRSTMKPVYSNGEFVPRLMLPYALSFDHRVIDGVAGAQFTRHLGVVMGDIRHILL
jgi:pyruvate dehydrogenase E2 component (dihydrolipoyllysine-residue acetyltransferase)